MLNLFSGFLFFFFTLFQVFQESLPHQEGSEELRINYPKLGEAVQGTVFIEGNTDIPDFYSYDVTFSYTTDSKDTWFLIEESFTPVQNSVLAEWNTFLITDGNYDLRIRVFLQDGSQQSVQVKGIRVRNYSVVETITLTPTITSTPGPTSDLTQAFFLTSSPTSNIPATVTPFPTGTLRPPTATNLPPNPIQLTSAKVSMGLLRGASAAVLLFVIIGIYNSINKNLQK